MKAKILIVDDARFMRMLLKDILVKAGYDVIGEAANGKEAIELYKKLKPDLVTMDIIMPDMSGVDVVRELKKIDPNVKVIMVTAIGQQALVEEAIEAGAKDYIVKPFQSSRVIEAVERVLKE